MKKNLIFIPPFPFDDSFYKSQYDFFKKDFNPIKINPYLQTDKVEKTNSEVTIDKFALEIYSKLKKMKKDKTILVGCSLGGYIILRYLELFPNSVQGIILLNTKPEADSEAQKKSRLSQISLINLGNKKEFLESFLNNSIHETTKQNKKKYDELFKNISKRTKLSLKLMILALVARTDTTENLINIKIPTLSIAGDSDKIIALDQMKNMSGRIQNSRLLIVPNSGHLSSFENPDFVNEEMFKFLKTV